MNNWSMDKWVKSEYAFVRVIVHAELKGSAVCEDKSLCALK